MKSGQKRVLRTIAVVVVTMSLLLLLAHVDSHGALALAMLVPDLLFGAVDVPLSLWTSAESAEARLLCPPDPEVLFQRPPPSLA